jgi:hypothetical protein
VGGTAVSGTPVGTRGQRGRTGSPAMNRSSCRRPQPVGSPPMIEWPTPGKVTRCAPGISDAMRAAVSGGVRRSSSPWRSSVGTAG